MTDLAATSGPKRLQIEAVILRAVPCPRHAAYEPGCSHCLTGEQAQAAGVKHRRDDLGVVADSARRWRYGPGWILAWWRTQRANAKARR